MELLNLTFDETNRKINATLIDYVTFYKGQFDEVCSTFKDKYFDKTKLIKDSKVKLIIEADYNEADDCLKEIYVDYRYMNNKDCECEDNADYEEIEEIILSDLDSEFSICKYINKATGNK